MRSILFFLSVLILSGNLLIADVNAVAASQSAERIIDVLEQKTFQRHITADLIQIARHGHLLSESEKDRLKNLGFDFTGKLVVLKSTESLFIYDTQHFRFHYDLTDDNAVDPTDTDPANGIPDYIDTMAEVFEEVYDHSINELGYVPPPSDGTHGGNDLYDVYIVQTNAYGYTVYIEPGVGDNPNSPLVEENNAYASFINMNSSYDGFSNTELENIQVTAAHEFFHAIQLGYDGDEELWLLEATAVWMEEEHYDEVNDCYQYLIPRFEKPHYSIKSISGLLPYGSFILFKYIDEHLGGKEMIKKTWEYSRLYDGWGDGEDYSIDVIDFALQENGHTFKKAFTNMVIANRILSDQPGAGLYAYEEALGYRDYLDISYGDTSAIILDTFATIDFNENDETTITSDRILQPYAAQYIKINSAVPVKLKLTEFRGSSIDDLSIHSIIKTYDGSYIVDSGQAINIDPGKNAEWIYAAVVSTAVNQSSLFNYELTATNGDIVEYFTITKNYPNPFNNSTNIKLNVTVAQEIDIVIYDLLGRKIRTLNTKYLAAGIHEFKWDGKTEGGSTVSSGVYYIAAQGANHQEWKKVTLVK